MVVVVVGSGFGLGGQGRGGCAVVGWEGGGTVLARDEAESVQAFLLGRDGCAGAAVYGVGDCGSRDWGVVGGDGAVGAHLTGCDSLSAIAEDVALCFVRWCPRRRTKGLTAIRLMKPRIKTRIPDPMTIRQNGRPSAC